jgi:hypothetical protein
VSAGESCLILGEPVEPPARGRACQPADLAGLSSLSFFWSGTLVSVVWFGLLAVLRHWISGFGLLRGEVRGSRLGSALRLWASTGAPGGALHKTVIIGITQTKHHFLASLRERAVPGEQIGS